MGGSIGRLDVSSTLVAAASAAATMVGEMFGIGFGILDLLRTANLELALRRGFHKDSEGTRTSRRLRCFPYVFMRLSPSEMIFKLQAVSKRKDDSPPATLPWTLRCQLLYSLRFPTNRFRNFGRIPFPPIRSDYHKRTHDSTPTFQGGFPRGLGPTYPCRTKLHMETYSASVFRVLNRIF